jgi:outer membrane lipoprotein-sorting protein
MSLLTYKDARPWARSIREKVLTRSMPPWHADPAFGKFANDRRLSQKELETIVAWVDGGAQEGDPKQLPSVPRFTEGWKIGTPDVVLTMPASFDVPAEGVIDYKYFSVPTHFSEDRWVQAAEVRPGNPKVVHHVIVFVEHPRGKPGEREGDRDRGLESLTGVAPGEEPMILPDGVGMLIPGRLSAGLPDALHPQWSCAERPDIGRADLQQETSREVHNGRRRDQYHLCYPCPRSELRSPIPYETDADCHLTSLMPHMHVRGKDFQYRLVYPDGNSRIILSVPHYDFNWQTRYEFADPLAAPKGSRIECVAHFDNSTGNKANPDPAKVVSWGPQTWDEMMIGFLEFTLDHERPRQAEPASSTPAVQRTDANASGTKPEPLPAVEQILDKYVQAIGGKAALLKQTSRVMKGTVTAPAFGATGTIELYAKSPNKQLTEMASSILGTWRLGFNGSLAWEEEDGEMKELPVFPKREADFYLPVKLQELYPRIELKGKERVGSREAYLLEAPRAGNPRRWYFDVETGLLLRTEARNAKGELLNREDYSDYRAVDEVQIAFGIRQIDEDGTELVIRLIEVKHNIPIDDAKFEKPRRRQLRARHRTFPLIIYLDDESFGSQGLAGFKSCKAGCICIARAFHFQIVLFYWQHSKRNRNFRRPDA